MFHNRVYYLFLFLGVLSLYYAYKERTLQAPPIAKRPLLAEHEYEEQKRRTTREEMAKLKATPAYASWEKERGRMKWVPPTPDDVDWDKLAQEVYED